MNFTLLKYLYNILYLVPYIIEFFLVPYIFFFQGSEQPSKQLQACLKS